MLTGYDMAVAFYDRNELAFTRAATSAKTKDREFDTSAEDFDDFLVSMDALPMTARDANDEMSRDGIVRARDKLRRKLIMSARKDKRLPRNFSIEAFGKGRSRANWRVLLLERYVAERPEEIVKGLARNLSHWDHLLTQAETLLENDEHLPDDERIIIGAQLAHERIQIFIHTQSVQLLVKSIRDGEAPKLRLLSRKIGALIDGTDKKPKRSPATPKRRPARHGKARRRLV